MTFEMVRLGWPNTAAILALAVMPVVALTSVVDRQPPAAQVRQIEPAAICLSLAECPVSVVVATPDTLLE